MYRLTIFNRFATLLTIAEAMLASVGCIREHSDEMDIMPEGPCIELSIITQSGTRAGETVDFNDDEKKMHSVDLFFYAANADEALYKPVLVWHCDDGVAEHKGTLNVLIPVDRVGAVFGGDGSTNGTCKVYAAINAPEVSAKAKELISKFETARNYNDGPTINGLREMKASTQAFSSKGEFSGFIMFTNEDVPASKDTAPNIVTYNATNRTASGKIYVKTLAAKIDLLVEFADEVSGKDGDARKWSPYDIPGTAEVYIINGVQAARLGGWNGGSELESNDYFDLRTAATPDEESDGGTSADRTKNPQRSLKTPSGDSDYSYITGLPLYTYANEWKQSALDVDPHQTSLMLKVNWLPENGKDPDELLYTYYSIPLNFKGSDDTSYSLQSGTYYRVKININTMGSQNIGEPLTVEDCSWEILDWSESNLEADIRHMRYLEVTQEQIDMNDGEKYTAIMNNTKSVTIPFKTSHKIKLTGVKFYYYIYDQSANNYAPQKVNILRYRYYKKDVAKKDDIDWIRPENTENAEATNSIAANVFTLDDAKLAAYAAETNPTDQEPQGVYIDELNNTITFYHSPYCLRGDGSKGRYFRAGIKNYSPYYITLTIQHEDDPSKSEEIKIVHYPAVYITYDANSGTTLSKSSGNIVPLGRKVAAGEYKLFEGGDQKQGRYGVYVNGGAKDTWTDYDENDGSNSLQLGGIGGTSIPANRNMYSIHVTQLEDDDKPTGSGTQGKLKIWGYDEADVKFHIGDPRNKNVNTYLDGGGNGVDLPDTEDTRLWDRSSYSSNRDEFRKVPAQVTGDGYAQRLYHTEENTLRYYYPTAEGQSEEQAFMVAPVFRLASGYTEVFTGRTSLGDRSTDNLSRANARRRCAALQDNGYPAGRWRVPTIGEMYFFKMLYNKGILPDLFPNTRAYWTAQYLTKFDYDNTDIRRYPSNALPSSHKWVRCVYDDWYWVRQDKKGNWVQDNIQSYSVKQVFNGVDYYHSFNAEGSSIPLILYDKNYTDTHGLGNFYSTDGDTREMFVWGDKEKKNPQQQPQDPQP